jgi:Protein of unknown function (DUF998)
LPAGAAAASLVFTGLSVASLVWLHIAPTGCSAVRNAVSEYGAGAYGRWYRTQATCTGIAALLLALALGHPTRVVTLLALLAGARVAIGWFPTDTRETPMPTRHGTIHLLLAATAFTAATWAATALKRTEHGQPALGWMMAVFAVGTMLSLRRSPLKRWLGLIERGYYVAMLAWLTLVAARLL